MASGEYSADERLDLFARRVDELWECQLVKSGGLRARFEMSFSEDAPLQLETSQPDEDLLRSFLLTFRQFVSTKEPVFVDRIHNLLWQRASDDQVRQNLATANGRWRASCKVGAMGLAINGRNFGPAEVLDIWINGRYFHTDKEKAAVLDQFDPTGTLLTRYLFMDHLVVATTYFTYLGNSIDGDRNRGLV